ncbi:MAG: short-chain fatty acyl-CoA regulator family protein [Rhodovibrionaceae bacterium]
MPQKVFLGARMRRFREANRLTQAAFAEALDISPSYLNQIEHDQRPLTLAVLQRLAARFRIDLHEFSDSADDRLVANLQDVLNDPLLAGNRIGLKDLRRVASAAPEVAQAMLTLHRAYRQSHDDYRSLAEKVIGDERLHGLEGAQFPYEEVRDYFYYRNNHIEELDEAAEALQASEGFRVGDMEAGLAAYLHSRHGIAVAHFTPGEAEARGAAPLRRLDEREKTLYLADSLTSGQRAFQLAYHIGLASQRDGIEQLVAKAGLSSREAGAVCRMGLANYFAGALLMPYGRFRETAEGLRYDIEQLQLRFGASFEQVCHRLSTLQRPGAKGVPFYFLRVDMAGNISKRASAGRFHFARVGGACPLWNVHEAFAAPGRILTQLAQLPDGTTYLCVARTVTKGGGGFLSPEKRFAVSIGCEIAHAPKLVYSSGLDLDDPSAIVPIGTSCRVCERADCAQRAFPPLGKAISVNVDERRFTPFAFSAEEIG